MKEDASSPTVSSEAVMLTCVVDANENREVAIVDIPDAFVQTVAEDEKDRAFIRIHGPLVNIMVSIAPYVYGPYVTVGKKGKKQLLVQCLTALYGTMGVVHANVGQKLLIRNKIKSFLGVQS